MPSPERITMEYVAKICGVPAAPTAPVPDSLEAQTDDELRRIEKSCWFSAMEKRRKAWALEDKVRNLLSEAQKLEREGKAAWREQAKRRGVALDEVCP